MWRWLILVGLAVLIWRIAQRPGDCVIRVRRGRAFVRGRIPARRRSEVERFLTAHFGHVQRMRIDVYSPRRDQRLRVRVRGAVTEGERQMIRNFLAAEL